MSIRDLGRSTKICHSTIQRVESGAGGAVSTMMTLAAYFGMTVDELLRSH